MTKSFLRGAFLLPFFFIGTVYAGGMDKIEDYFSSLYLPVPEFSSWLKKSPKEEEKDLFLASFMLPQTGRTEYKYNIPVKIIKSITHQGRDYFYFYIKAEKSVSFSLIISGVKSASLDINGTKKGEINLKDHFNYAKTAATLEKGVYLFSFTVNEFFGNMPVTVLSNKQIELSTKKGFNLNAKAAAKIENITENYIDAENVFRTLIEGFCFPYKDEDVKSREVFFSLSEEDASKKMETLSLIQVLSLSVNKEEAKKYLLKNGFSDDKIDWWQKNLKKRKVCAYEFVKDK